MWPYWKGKPNDLCCWHCFYFIIYIMYAYYKLLAQWTIYILLTKNSWVMCIVVDIKCMLSFKILLTLIMYSPYSFHEEQEESCSALVSCYICMSYTPCTMNDTYSFNEEQLSHVHSCWCIMHTFYNIWRYSKLNNVRSLQMPELLEEICIVILGKPSGLFLILTLSCW